MLPTKHCLLVPVYIKESTLPVVSYFVILFFERHPHLYITLDILNNFISLLMKMSKMKIRK